MKEYESKRIGWCLLLHMTCDAETDDLPFLLNIDHIETVAPSESSKAVIITSNASYHVEETFDEVMALMDPSFPPVSRSIKKTPQ